MGLSEEPWAGDNQLKKNNANYFLKIATNELSFGSYYTNRKQYKFLSYPCTVRSERCKGIKAGEIEEEPLLYSVWYENSRLRGNVARVRIYSIY